MQATIQYFEKRFFINIKWVLEFYHPSKFLCQTSGRQIIGPYPTNRMNLHHCSRGGKF
jgi:hypothetical protein